MAIYKASFDTRTFEFTAYGSTKAEAKKTIKTIFLQTMEKYQGSYTWNDVKEDVWIEEIKLNVGYVR